ncbi:MAG: hypothetical protein QG656_2007 [Candidatus Hydrogenedentes bacterium]|nr:hypothetical protein [Candidatus Hydrogenedentota bacterium]
MKTDDNLLAAFAGESQANRKYLAFAKKADSDGFPQVAKLFRAAAAAETVHAHAHLRALNGVKGTAENLDAAIAGEGHEFKEMYPEFVATAEQEEQKRALLSFKNAMADEQIHFALYSEAKAAVAAGKDLSPAPIYVCEVCGNTVVGAPEGACPVCGAPKEKFTVIE